MMSQFNQLKHQAGGSLLLTQQQQQWITIQKLLTATRLQTRWHPPAQTWRKPVFSFIYGGAFPFDNVMLGVIGANFAVLCMVSAGAELGYPCHSALQITTQP
jgi:hypothetical protein